MQFTLLFLLIFLASLAEIVSIGSVLPFLAILSAPERMLEHPFAEPFKQFLGLTDARQALLALTIAFSVGALLAGTLRLVLAWVQTRLGHAIGADFSLRIYRCTLYQPYITHIAKNSSEIIAAISNKTDSVVHEVLLPSLALVSSALMLMVILAVLFTVDPTAVATAIIGFGGIYAIVMSLTRRRVARDSKLISREKNQVIKALQEGLGGIRDVLINGTQETYCNIYRSADLPLRRAAANIQIVAIIPRYGIEALSMVLIAILAFTISNRSDGVTDALPILGTLALCAQRLLPLLQLSYSSWSTLRGGKASLIDVLDLMDQRLPEYIDAPLGPAQLFRHHIALDRLSFRYSPQEPWVLRELNLTIPKGARVGIIGPSGGGKSTLLDIFMALLSPTSGSLSVDGVVVTADNHRIWQAQIAHVPQSIFLADSTIGENIAFGVPKNKIDWVRLRDSAEKAQLHQTVESWEMKYETQVGERGIQLSGGQRQRIGIARALYRQAEVIIFDEATSSLDDETERAVMDAVENLGGERTVLIVAHRLTTLKSCTLIVELDKGKIRRIGSYRDIVGEQ